jgi:hypothetical protein
MPNPLGFQGESISPMAQLNAPPYLPPAYLILHDLLSLKVVEKYSLIIDTNVTSLIVIDPASYLLETV